MIECLRRSSSPSERKCGTMAKMKLIQWMALSKISGGMVLVKNEREAISVSPSRNGLYGVKIGDKFIPSSPKRILSLEYRDRRNATRRATYAAQRQLVSV